LEGGVCRGAKREGSGMAGKGAGGDWNGWGRVHSLLEDARLEFLNCAASVVILRWCGRQGVARLGSRWGLAVDVQLVGGWAGLKKGTWRLEI